MGPASASRRQGFGICRPTRMREDDPGPDLLNQAIMEYPRIGGHPWRARASAAASHRGRVLSAAPPARATCWRSRNLPATASTECSRARRRRPSMRCQPPTWRRSGIEGKPRCAS